MGPVMNLVLAIVVMAVVLYQGAQVPAFEQQPVVDRLVLRRPRSPQAAGMQAGDRIVTVDGKPVDTWEQFSIAILPKAKREVSLGFDPRRPAGQRHPGSRRAGQVRDGRHRRAAGRASPGRRASSTGSPAEEAGLQPGDVILAAGGETTCATTA